MSAFCLFFPSEAAVVLVVVAVGKIRIGEKGKKRKSHFLSFSLSLHHVFFFRSHLHLWKKNMLEQQQQRAATAAKLLDDAHCGEVDYWSSIAAAAAVPSRQASLVFSCFSLVASLSSPAARPGPSVRYREKRAGE